MRRLFVAVAVCAAILLLAGSAVAQPHPAASTHHPASGPQAGTSEGIHAKASFVPLGARLAASTPVSGTVYNSSHAGLPSIDVEWDSLVAGTSYWGTGTTDGAGHYSMTARPTTSGEIWAYPDADTTFARGMQTWTNGVPAVVDLYPGTVSVTAYRGGTWANVGLDGVTARLFGDMEFSKGAVTASGATASPVTGVIDAVDGTYNAGGSVKFFYDEGVEFSDVVTVTSGALSPTAITVDEADAQRVWIKSPFWWSGKPGATITLVRNNFPAGWRNFVTGYTDDPKQTSYKEYGTKVSQGAASESLQVKIPTTAKPGYGYFVGFQHVDASGDPLPLYVEEQYQVCTMKPSKSAISKGARIRISGIVPTEGHWGSQMGKRKYVWILWHRGTAPVPTNANATKQGWVPLARVRTTGTGAYTSPYLAPPRTGTFVAQYDGDNWYWPAYTSTAKVTVR